MRSIVGLIVIIWLVIGAVAAGQRGYFGGDKNDAKNCNRVATTAVTIVAGPLNYAGVNPKINCNDVNVPQPSK